MSSDGSTSSSAGSDRSSQAGDASPSPTSSVHEDEVSLLDILLVLARNKTLIFGTVLVFTLIGVTYAVMAPEKYTSSAKVVRETQTDGGGGLPGGFSPSALSGLGLNLGGAASGLTPAAYPEVLQGRRVRLAVVQDTFRFPRAERRMTFVDYVNRPPGTLDTVLKYTLMLPWTLKDAFGKAITGSPAPAGTTQTGGPVIVSREEDKALETVSEMVSTSVDQESGLMTISVVASSRRLAADLAESFLTHFTRRVRRIRTENVRERLDFVESRFQEVKEELEAAEDRLAQFLERNQNPTAPQLQFQRARLQRQVSFKEQLYSELQSQLTQTRLDLQRRQPVVTVVEEPVPPIDRSAPSRTFIVLLMVVVGGILGVLGAFLRTYIRSASSSRAEEKKLQEIKNAFRSTWGLKSVLSRKGTGSENS